jgi:hypothetical protein
LSEGDVYENPENSHSTCCRNTFLLAIHKEVACEFRALCQVFQEGEEMCVAGGGMVTSIAQMTQERLVFVPTKRLANFPANTLGILLREIQKAKSLPRRFPFKVEPHSIAFSPVSTVRQNLSSNPDSATW